MTGLQKRILLIAAVILLAMFLFPPQNYCVSGADVCDQLFWGFILDMGPEWIDWPILLLQFLGLGIITLIAILARRPKG